jgi:hypothetical protein
MQRSRFLKARQGSFPSGKKNEFGGNFEKPIQGQAARVRQSITLRLESLPVMDHAPEVV